MIRRRLFAAAALVLGLLCMALAARAETVPQARQGVLDLRYLPASDAAPVLELRGEWGFAWHRFLDPAAPAAPTAFAPVPSAWNDVTADGKPPGPDGWGSYTLRVECPAGQPLALALPAQRSALRLYVNGRLAGYQGEPGESAETARPAIGGRAIVTEPRACPLDITVHLSNYSHRAGGFVRPLMLGPGETLASQLRTRLVQDMTLLGAYLVLGLLPIIVFLARRKDTTPLLFGLFCLMQALYADISGERQLLQLFAVQTPWEVYLKLEYLAFFAAPALFLLLVQRMFATESPRRLIRGLLSLSAACIVVVVLAPARISSHLVPLGQALTVAIGMTVTWAVGRAAQRRKPGAGVLLGGLAFLLAVVLLDTLVYNVGAATRSITPYGLLVFVLSPAVLLAQRMARALNAEELRALEQRAKGDLLVRTTKAGILDWDTTTNQVSYSPRLKEMLGFAPDAETARWPVFYDFVHPLDQEVVRARFRAQLTECTVASGEVRHEPTEYRLRRADGSTVWVLAQAISLTGSDKRTLRFLCSFIDITEHRAMEEGLKASRDQVAAQAAQLQAQNAALEENARLREDVERMSRHDLKTPLNSIIGVTRLLREDPALAPEHRELLGIAERAGYRMLELVNLSLDLYRMEVGSYEFRPQAVNLGDVVARVAEDMRGLAEAAKVTVNVARGDGLPVYAHAEELLCYSILANLLRNAVEATPPGGTVRVSLQAGTPVSVRIHNAGEVAPAAAARFFDKYVSVGKGGGTGLGTYSARLMARVQQGDLAMRSSAQEGTLLTLTLPPLGAEAVPPAAVLAGPHTAPAPLEAGLVSCHVLVVDDDEYNRLIVRRYLPSPPFTVETAVNGQAATEAATRRWPDVVLMDMEMPVMDGATAVAWLRRQQAAQGRPPLRIIMLSSNDDEASIRRGLEAGADRYMTKPVSRAALLAALRKLQPEAVPSSPAPLAAAGEGTVAPPAPGDTVQVDSELAEELPAFLASRRELVEEMDRALQRGDRGAVRDLAHRAGGGLALCGFKWAAWQCRQIELDAAAAAASELDHRIAELREHLRTVRVLQAQQP